MAARVFGGGDDFSPGWVENQSVNLVHANAGGKKKIWANHMLWSNMVLKKRHDDSSTVKVITSRKMVL